MKSLKALYRNLKKSSKKSKMSVITESEDEDFPTLEAVMVASKEIMDLFPYESLDELYDLPRELNIDMIKSDFPTLSESDIKEQIQQIEKYYSDNLDYLVLERIAQSPEQYDNLSRLKKTKSTNTACVNLFDETLLEAWTYYCTMFYAVLNGFGFVRSSISYGWSASDARNSGNNKYPNSNDRKDAYRHTLWSALLAQNYYTVSSKKPRLEFSKLVADLHENYYCRPICYTEDSNEMDYHKNNIGRKIWDSETSYLTFGSWSFGLNTPGASTLKIIIYEKIEKNSCYIVKRNEQHSAYNLSDAETKAEILKINENTPVYYVGPIAPTYLVKTVRFDYSDCNDFGDDKIEFDDSRYPQTPIFYDNIINKSRLLAPPVDEDCEKIITEYKRVTPCFVTQDPNYKPYQ